MQTSGYLGLLSTLDCQPCPLVTFVMTSVRFVTMDMGVLESTGLWRRLLFPLTENWIYKNSLALLYLEIWLLKNLDDVIEDIHFIANFFLKWTKHSILTLYTGSCCLPVDIGIKLSKDIQAKKLFTANHSPRSSILSDMIRETITKRALTVNIVMETIITARATNFCRLVRVSIWICRSDLLGVSLTKNSLSKLLATDGSI